MKFRKNNENNKKLDNINENTNICSEDIEQKLENKKKMLEKMQYSSVIMLIIALTALIVGLMYMDKVYKTYSIMTSSTVYAGLMKRDEENDTLENTQKLMNEIENLFEASYVNEIERSNIDEYVLNALVDAYGDKYASYRDPIDTNKNNNSKKNKVFGIGVYMTPEYKMDTNEYSIYIIDVYKNSPAEAAGIKPGDSILAINNHDLSILDFDYSAALDEISGEIGTTVNLKILSNSVIQNIDVKRDEVSYDTIRYREVANGIGYIEIRDFLGNTDEEFKAAIDYFTNKGINKFIFDLTGNSGGMEDSVVNMLDSLLQNGLIVEEYDSSGNLIKSVKANPDTGLYFESVTLINHHTASAAELFTKCLSDNGYTTVVGTKSYGKATVCTTFTLSNGGSVTLSTGKYLTSSHKDIEGIGIEPDIELELSKEKQSIAYKLPDSDNDLIQKAIEVLQQ